MLAVRMRTKPRGPLIVGALVLVWVLLVLRWATTSFHETLTALDLTTGRPVATVTFRCPTLFSGAPLPTPASPPGTRLERTPCSRSIKEHRYLLVVDGVVTVAGLWALTAWARHRETEIRATLPGHPRD
jgi:hypothetical protein